MPILSEGEIQRYATVSNLLAGGNAPSWFTKSLCILGKEAMPGFRSEFKRIEDRQRLVRMSDLAAELSGLFSDQTVTRLVQEAKSIEQYLPSLVTQLPMLAKIAKQAADAIPTGPGPAKARVKGRPTAREFCALVICEGWALFHGGKPPGVSNEKAQRAADQFWELSGGKPPEKPEALERWRLHMERVREHRLGEWVSEKLRRRDWGD